MTRMRIERFGRLWVAANASGARGYLERSLYVPYGKRERLSARVSAVRPDEEKELDLGPDGHPVEPRFAAVGDALSSVADKGETPQWILVEDYEAGRGRAIVFLFPAGAGEPFAVVKVRTGDEGPPLRRERDALERIGTGAMRESVPAVRAFREEEGREILTLTSLPGASMYREMKATLQPARHVRRHFEHAAAWLERFRATVPGAHGDFWARNVLLDGANVSVVDWENFDSDADPLLDVFHFPLTYALAFRWSGPDVSSVDRFRRGFCDRTRVSSAIRWWMRQFGAATGDSAGELRRRFDDYLARGGEGEIARPHLERSEWIAMREQLGGGAPCAFSG